MRRIYTSLKPLTQLSLFVFLNCPAKTCAFSLPVCHTAHIRRSTEEEDAQDPHKRKRGRPLEQRVMLRAPHPQASTHELKRRTRPVLPQANCDLPARPVGDATPAERETYACFAIGNFCSNRDSATQPLQPGETWWKRFEEWSDNGTAPHTRFALTILRHMSSHSGTRARGAKQLQLRRRQQALALQLQPQPAAQHPSQPTAHNGSDSDDDGAWEVPDPDAPAAEQHYSLLEDMADAPAAPATSLSAYVASSTSLLADATFTAAPANHATIQQPLDHRLVQQQLQHARRAAADYSPAFLSTTNSSSSTGSSTRLQVLQGGRAWRLDVLPPHDDSAAPQPDVITAAVQPPPFVRAAHPPMIRETVQLFSLSPDQALAFTYAAHRLQQECHGAQLAPLLMVIVGRPGTGERPLHRIMLPGLEFCAHKQH